MDTSKRNVEKIIKKWVDNGSASRRINGVYFNLNSSKNEVELGVISGLNCRNGETKSPLHKQMHVSKGDDALSLNEEDY